MAFLNGYKTMLLGLKGDNSRVIKQSDGNHVNLENSNELIVPDVNKEDNR